MKLLSIRLHFVLLMTVGLFACQSISKCEKAETVLPVEPKPKEIVVQQPPDLALCEELVKPETIIINKCPKPQKKKKTSDGVAIIGQTEEVAIMPEGILLDARIDTGATTSSLGVERIEYYERDGKPWVKFAVRDPKDEQLIEFNLKRERRVRIKQHDKKDDRRPVVKLRVILGKIDQVREFTLANREQYKYPVLIGRNYLMDKAIVDVSQKNTVRTTVPN